MSRLRLPLRLARREVLRRPGRTLLVALLVALPVAGMSIVTTLIRTDHRTPAEEWASEAATADARLFREMGPQPVEGAAVDLPPGSRTITSTFGFARVRTDDGRRSDLDITDRPLLDPMTRGILDLVAGRAPAAPGEVALTAKTARRLGTALGETLVLDRPSLRLSVVGLVEDPDCLGCPSTVLAPGEIPDELAGDGFTEPLLVDLPELDAVALDALAAREDLELRTEFLQAPRDDESEGLAVSYVMGGVVLTVMGIVISAAFAVGARRQLVTLGQLSATGASPATVRTMLVLQGTVTGLVGGFVGLVLAAMVLLPFHGWIETVLDHRFGSYSLHPLDHLLAVGVGAAAATVAALIPARSAATVPTLAALAGRRPQHPVSARLVAAGLLGVLVGLGLFALAVLGSAGDSGGDVWPFVAILGGVCELLGACAIAPALVARLEPLAARVRGSWRLAARSLARQRTRTGAVVSAVAATGALAIATTALVHGADGQEDQYLDIAEDVVAVHELVDVPMAGSPKTLFSYAPELPSAAVRARLARILPDATPIELELALAPALPADPSMPGELQDPAGFISVEWPSEGGPSTGFGFGWAAIADDRVVDLVGLSADGRAALAETGVVLLRRTPEPPAELVVEPSGDRLPVPVVAAEHLVGRGSDLLMTEELAARLGLEVRVAELVFDNPAPLTEAQRDAVEDVQLDGEGPLSPSAGGPARYLDLWWYQPSTGPSAFQLELILSGVALVFALFVVGASLALAAAESKDERDVLTVAGAPPRALARAAGARAWLLAGVGGLLALPIGFLPVVVFTQAEDDDFPLVFPGTTVFLLVVVVPALVALVADGASATAQWLRPVRVSTATFE